MPTFEIQGVRNGNAGQWRVKAATMEQARGKAEANGVQVTRARAVPDAAPASRPAPPPVAVAIEEPEPGPEAGAEAPQEPVGLDYAGISAEADAHESRKPRPQWVERITRDERQQQWVRMHAGEAFAMGFWAAIGAMMASVIVTVLIFILLFFTGTAILHR